MCTPCESTGGEIPVSPNPRLRPLGCYYDRRGHVLVRSPASKTAARVLEVASKPLAGGCRAYRHFIGGRGRNPSEGAGGANVAAATSPPLPSSFTSPAPPRPPWCSCGPRTRPRPVPAPSRPGLHEKQQQQVCLVRCTGTGRDGCEGTCEDAQGAGSSLPGAGGARPRRCAGVPRPAGAHRGARGGGRPAGVVAGVPRVPGGAAQRGAQAGHAEVGDGDIGEAGGVGDAGGAGCAEE